MTGRAITLADMEAMARATIAALPAPFAAGASGIVLRVEEWPDEDMLRDLGIDDPLELTGLYDGIPMTEKSFSDPAPWPDTVWLFRRPILAEWRDRGDVEIADLVAHVTVHELAHHFGWSDEDIAVIDRWWE
ncbi:Predicted Zn-dependent protease, minimal metalloprotease (MMP)-like domain [Roseivivax lentus]|uniref:Predicted Zn-dependent protease, minimal metalloprotease (MMP)-like domain n=2 Tax=Roseivivax lentus TaxID=633194 RepID=A0A1N7L5P1_9RHOB|nr:Predicted Zn-dependent protease, minimal metalloprotease (MMP)-like domain [Roseivivax lentus]